MKTELKLRTNKHSFEFLEAYGKLFGCDAEWAAMCILREGIVKLVDNEFLSKAQKEMSIGRKITNSTDGSPDAN